jgi:hypothetical protein
MPIWVSSEPLEIGTSVPIQTADGTINYEVKEETYLCANDLNGEANPNDTWAQTRVNLDRNYEF